MITEELKPFHRQNLEKFDLLFAAMNKLSGSFKTAAWIIGFIISVAGLIVAVAELRR